MVGPDQTRDGGPETTLRQISLRRLQEFDIKPKRDLGQNFLIDDNILSVILGQLECDSRDVVLEIGAGLGVLTQALASAACWVHAFEIDRSLEGPLDATLRDHANVTLHFQDILKAPMEDLDPVPTLCASNLPYCVAGPFLIEALRRLPDVRRYCVMVQKEVADRIAAPPGSKTFGVLSVWIQLYAVIRRSRALARSIFYPQPHVDSSLLVLDRLPADQTPDCDPVALQTVIQSAFGQRRKTLVNALQAGTGLDRAGALELVQSLGLPPDVRAERLHPRQFVELARLLNR